MMLNDEAVSGWIALHQIDEGNFALNVQLASDAVGRLDVQIVDFAGNVPRPEALSLSPVDEWKKWVSKGDAGIGSPGDGGSAQLTVILLGENDREIAISTETVEVLGHKRRRGPRRGAPKGQVRSPKVRA